MNMLSSTSSIVSWTQPPYDILSGSYTEYRFDTYYAIRFTAGTSVIKFNWILNPTSNDFTIIAVGGGGGGGGAVYSAGMKGSQQLNINTCFYILYLFLCVLFVFFIKKNDLKTTTYIIKT